MENLQNPFKFKKGIYHGLLIFYLSSNNNTGPKVWSVLKGILMKINKFTEFPFRKGRKYVKYWKEIKDYCFDELLRPRKKNIAREKNTIPPEKIRKLSGK